MNGFRFSCICIRSLFLVLVSAVTAFVVLFSSIRCVIFATARPASTRVTGTTSSSTLLERFPQNYVRVKPTSSQCPPGLILHKEPYNNFWPGQQQQRRRVIFVRFCPVVKLGRDFFDPDQNCMLEREILHMWRQAIAKHYDVYGESSINHPGNNVVESCYYRMCRPSVGIVRSIEGMPSVSNRLW